MLPSDDDWEAHSISLFSLLVRLLILEFLCYYIAPT